MKIPTMGEAMEHSIADRDELVLSDKCPYMYHDTPQWRQMGKGGEDEKAYYFNVSSLILFCLHPPRFM
jgi:hypothetical protein